MITLEKYLQGLKEMGISLDKDYIDPMEFKVPGVRRRRGVGDKRLLLL